MILSYTKHLFFVFLFLTASFSCSEKTETIRSDPYLLDFSSLEYPELEYVNEKYLEGLIEINKKLVQIQESTGIYCNTDKRVYHQGEDVILTIENKSKWEEYIFPSENVGRRILDTLNASFDKKSFQKELVSTSPAVQGNLSFHHSSYVELHVSGVSEIVASKFGFHGFSEPLGEGGSLQFKVKMPERKGRYSIKFNIYSHEKAGSLGDGLCGFVCSNVIEVQ